jgi:sugar lactone lactonase YvrE/thiol-disulfide isomerase/thioredoxin
MYKIRAPELEPYLAWLNTTRPLSLRDLRGQLVILDFWTYCCVNCMHVIPVLRDLERRHRNDPLVVIGVHSAKFETESRPERVADAIARYGIEHPVVVDRDMGIWERFAVRSWPTLVIVRPDGTIAAVAPGEPDPDLLEQFVQQQLEQARQAGTLASGPMDLGLLHPVLNSTLSFPGNVSVAPDGRLAISDSGHHRVLITTHDGRVQETLGSGLRGLADGSFAECAFDDPQGVAWDGNVLWIADSRNHAIRRADLTKREVTTFAGTGRMAAALVQGRAPGREVDLRTPWDVLPYRDKLFVAMAGSHQIWTLDKRTGEAEPFAGSGREALVDGPLLEAAFAQPSGLALEDETLFVADSETSAVRAIDLARGEVHTLVGEGLFDFGDVDGPARTARLQHALGVAVASDGALIVADTYNDRLRRIDRQSERVGTFYRAEGNASLREPAGIAAAEDGSFLVADTNNHRVVRIAADGRSLEPITITGAPEAQRGDLHALSTGPHASQGAGARWFVDALEPDAGHTFGEGEGVLSLTIAPPDGWKLAVGSPARVALEVSRRSDLLSLAVSTRSATVAGIGDVVFPIAAHIEKLPQPEIASEVLVTVDAMLCTEGDAARCVPTRGWFRLPLTLRRGGDRALGYHLPLAAPAAE